jgi:hypothetical protein
MPGATTDLNRAPFAPITVTMRDVRCSMVNLDPDSATPAPEVMKAVVRANQSNTGICGAVICAGRRAVGQAIFLRAATETSFQKRKS